MPQAELHVLLVFRLLVGDPRNLRAQFLDLGRLLLLPLSLKLSLGAK